MVTESHGEATDVNAYRGQIHYNIDNSIRSQSDLVSSYEYTYDAIGNPDVVTQSNLWLSNPHLVDYDFNSGGQLDSRSILSSGQTLIENSFSYDALGRVESFEESGSRVSDKSVGYSYNAISDPQAKGRLSAIYRFGATNVANGSAEAHPAYEAHTQFVYDLNSVPDLEVSHWAKNIADTNGAIQPVSKYLYIYDLNGKIDTLQREVGQHVAGNEQNLTLVTDLNYSELVQNPSGDINPRAPENHDFDDNGNRSLAGSIVHDRVIYDDSYTYEYDNEGNVIRRTENALPPVSIDTTIDLSLIHI